MSGDCVAGKAIDGNSVPRPYSEGEALQHHTDILVGTQWRLRKGTEETGRERGI